MTSPLPSSSGRMPTSLNHNVHQAIGSSRPALFKVIEKESYSSELSKSLIMGRVCPGLRFTGR